MLAAGTILGPLPGPPPAGSGGMGEGLPRARHPSRARRAVKVIQRRGGARPGAHQALRAGGARAGALSHPNVSPSMTRHALGLALRGDGAAEEGSRCGAAAGGRCRCGRRWSGRRRRPGLAAAAREGIVHTDLSRRTFRDEDGRVRAGLWLAKLTRPDVLGAGGEEPVSVAGRRAGRSGDGGYMSPTGGGERRRTGRSDRFGPSAPFSRAADGEACVSRGVGTGRRCTRS